MLRFVAIDEASSEEEEQEKEERIELQEARCLAAYKKALQFQQQGNTKDAEATYLQLLDTPLLQGRERNEPSIQKLRYLCLKNLAALYKKKEELNTSLQYYVEAVALEDQDVVVWHHIGQLASHLGNLTLARYALEKGLTCNPSHWLCLEEIIQAIRLDAGYKPARLLREHLLGELGKQPRWPPIGVASPWDASKLNLQQAASEATTKNEAPMEYYLKEVSWKGLTTLLLHIHQNVVDKGISLGKPLVIRIEKFTLSNRSATNQHEQASSATQTTRGKGSSGREAKEAKEQDVEQVSQSAESSQEGKQSKLKRSTDRFGSRRSSRVKESSDASTSKQADIHHFIRKFMEPDLLTTTFEGGQESSARGPRGWDTTNQRTTKRYHPTGNSLSAIMGEQQALSRFLCADNSQSGTAKQFCGIIHAFQCFFHSELFTASNIIWSPELKEQVLRIGKILDTPQPSARMYHIVLAELCFDLAKQQKTVTASAHFPLSEHYLSSILVGWDQCPNGVHPALAIRLLWLLARVEAAKQNHKGAISYFKLCQRSLGALVQEQRHPPTESYGLCFRDRSILLPHCNYGHVIDESHLNKKMAKLQYQDRWKQVKLAFQSEDYDKVIDLLEAQILPPLPSATGGSTATPLPVVAKLPYHIHLQMLDLLQQAYRYEGAILKALWAGRQLLHEATADINNQELMIRQATQSLLQNLENAKKENPLFAEPLFNKLNTSLQSCIAKALFELEESSVNKSLMVPLLLTFYHLHRLRPSTHFALQLRFLRKAHNLLAAKGLCRAEHGQMLHVYIDTIHKAQDEISHHENCDSSESESSDELPSASDLQTALYQCFYCLYAIEFMDHKELEEHPHNAATPPSKETRDKESLAEMFETCLLPFSSHLSSCSSRVKNSVYQTLLDLYSSFEQLPPQFAHGKPYVLDVIAGNPRPLFNETKQDEDHSHGDSLSSVYNNLYYLLARCMRKDSEPQQSTKHNARLTTSWLCKQDLFANPRRVESWRLLGNLYRDRLDQLLEDHLPWDLSQPLEAASRITDYRGRATRCLEEAIELDSNDEETWRTLGTIYHTQARYLRQAQMQVLSWEMPIERTPIYQQSYECFKHAYDLQPEYWLNPYLLGKLCCKLGKNPKEYLELFAQAAALVSKSSTSGLSSRQAERLSTEGAEAFYRLHASRTKLLLNMYLGKDSFGQVETLEAIRAHPFDRDAFKGSNATSEATSTETGWDETTSLLLEDCIKAMKHCRRLYPYFHKSVYLHAFALRNGPAQSITESKQVLATLFNDKKLGRKFVDIWRTHFEEPGKFETYRRKYILFYIQLLWESKDHERLDVLLFKLQRDPVTAGQKDLIEPALLACIRALEYHVQQLITSTTHITANHAPPAIIDLTSSAESTEPQRQQEENKGLSVVQGDATKFLQKSYDLYRQSMSFKEKEAHRKSAESLLVSAYQLYLYPNPTSHSGSLPPIPTSENIVSICQRLFKPRDKKKRPHSYTQESDTTTELSSANDTLDVSQAPVLSAKLSPESSPKITTSRPPKRKKNTEAHPNRDKPQQRTQSD
ncbi:Calcineurin-binding protein cabin-1 [Balamuthia mandrillaris]